MQVKSETQVDNIRLLYGFLQDARCIQGEFGFGQIQEVGMTLGANSKAGMDIKEFTKYLFTTVVPLYPDAADKQGKCGVLVSFL